MRITRRRSAGFSLVELLVVIGIIAVLIGMLMPSLHKARIVAQNTACRSNLHQVGLGLSMYATANRGAIFPLGADNRALGGYDPPEGRWTRLAFGNWKPTIMYCPLSENPQYEHSYVLNFQIVDLGVTKLAPRVNGCPSSQVVLMGEKWDHMIDYFVRADTYDVVVEEYKHGRGLASNALFLDGHVGPIDTRRLPNQPNPFYPGFVQSPDAAAAGQ